MTALRLGFAGTPDFAARHLEALINSPHQLALVLTQPDRPAGRGKRPQPSPVKTLATAHDIPVLQPATLRDSAVQADLAAQALDALVVVAYGLILPQAVLDLPRHGCLNVHGSLLPRWRGAAPIQRAIEAGDEESGVTIMQMEAGLDTGPMLAVASCPIGATTTAADLYERLAILGPALLLEVLADLPRHLANARVQDDQLATYAAKIDKGEAQIDWQQPAAILARRIHAFTPSPGCFSFLDGERVKLHGAEVVNEDSRAAPGTILHASEAGIDVACGSARLRLTTLQFPGARALDAADILRGRGERLAPGQRFEGAP